jgi:class 3 adenylate cyclase
MPGDGHPITILFTDVQGSTQLRARHGDRVADEMLGDHEAIVRRAIGAYGGAEVAFLGDGFLATFGTPAAGLSCAIAIQQALQSYGRDNADRRIRVRIGLHHGEVTERDGNLYGQAVHAASRVMSEAVGGQILVTAAVRDAVEATGTFSFVDRGCAGSPTAGGCTRWSGDATPRARPGRSARPRSWGASGSGPTCAGRSRTPASDTARWCWSRAKPGSARPG